VEDFLAILFVLVLLFGMPWLIGWLSVLLGRREREAQPEDILREVNSMMSMIKRRMTIRSVPDSFPSPEGGRPLRVMKLLVSGSITVPSDNHRACFRVTIADVTDLEDHPNPIFCMIRDLADEDGMYSFKQETTIPYAFSELNETPITAIPLFAIVCPRKGTRKVRVLVQITPQDAETPVYSSGAATFTFTQEAIGYLEIRAQREVLEEAMASLSIAIAAMDGRIDKSESGLIHRFFAERYAGYPDSEERQTKISNVTQQTLSLLLSKRERPVELAHRLCDDLRAEGEPEVIQTAYELCARVVAADEKVHQKEHQALSFVAEHLDVPEQFVRETHDRIFRVSMYEEIGEENLVDMPADLTEAEKREFLNREYDRWRARVTHDDPDIAAEASLRIERIVKLRKRLSNV